MNRTRQKAALLCDTMRGKFITKSSPSCVATASAMWLDRGDHALTIDYALLVFTCAGRGVVGNEFKLSIGGWVEWSRVEWTNEG
jgi:hypothetical protein